MGLIQSIRGAATARTAVGQLGGAGVGRCVLACVAPLFALSCTPMSLPGTSLGTYNVEGTLGTNTCGAGLNAENPWSFTAQMSEDGTTLYWASSDGTELSGPMSSATQVSITTVQTTNVDGTDAGPGPCDLQSTAVLDLALASASPPPKFTGSLGYTFVAATGVSIATNCTDQLSASGGPYDTLPCSATYSLSGTHQ